MITERMKKRIEIRAKERKDDAISLALRLAEKAEEYEASGKDNFFAEMAAEKMDRNLAEFGIAW